MKKIFIDWERLRGAVQGKQIEIAEKVGISQPTLSLKLRKQRKISFDELNKIADALNRDTIDFIIQAEKLPRYLDKEEVFAPAA